MNRDYLKRLETLNGGPLQRQPVEGPDVEEIRHALRRPSESRPAADTIRLLRDLPRQSNALPAYTPSEQHIVLEEAVDGDVIDFPERGQAYLITTTLHSLGQQGTHVRENFHRALDRSDAPIHRRFAEQCRGVTPDDLVFIDLETTGLGHSPLFLIGAMTWEDDDLVVRQYLARHYGEEAAATHLFLEEAARKRLLISFNGKSFDYPYLRARAAANGIPWRFHIAHFDLLHESRRAWKGTLPNCRLQTLEQCICGRPPRHGDIPGARIPDAYHAYVRTSNACEMVQIIQHNLHDLVTLAELMSRLPDESDK